MPAKRLRLGFDIQRFHIGNEFHEMAGAGIDKPSSKNLPRPGRIYHMKAHCPAFTCCGGGRVGRPRQDFSIVKPVRRSEYIAMRRWSRSIAATNHIGESHDTTPPVAAHHPSAAVRVVELHAEIISRGFSQDHQSVSGVFHTEEGYELRITVLGNICSASVQDYEDIACSGEFMKEVEWVLQQIDQVLKRSNLDAHKTKVRDGKQ